MKLRHAFSLSLKALIINASRSALTILGIVIGIMSIMLIFTVGHGAEGLIVNELSGLGANTITVAPGREPEGPSQIAQNLFSDSLKRKDLDALQNPVNVPELERAAPVVIVASPVSYRGETYRPTMLGTDVEFVANTFGIFLEQGSFFSEPDIRQRARVAVIGHKVKEELFGEQNAIGETIKINQQNFRVLGVFPPRGQIIFFNLDETVFVPWSTAQDYLLGIDYFSRIIMQAKSPDLVNRAVQNIQLTLRESHDISDPSKDDFFVVTQQGLVDQVGIILNVLTIFLSAVVAIALVVGGIGVMNIMLVSVTERTREIGLRKAVGATREEILTQFLIEAILITLAGGLVGVSLGTILSFGLSVLLTEIFHLAWPFAFPVEAALIGTGVSAVVGLVFGIYPARQAAQKSPIEALQYE